MMMVIPRRKIVIQQTLFDESLPGSGLEGVLKLRVLSSLVVQSDIEIVVAPSDQQDLKAFDPFRLSEREHSRPFARDSIVDAAIREFVGTEQIGLGHGGKPSSHFVTLSGFCCSSISLVVAETTLSWYPGRD